MKTIYLQRQGSSENFNTNNSINSQLKYYIGVQTWAGNYYRITIILKSINTKNKSKNQSIQIDATFPSLSDAFRRVEKELLEQFSENFIISDTIEMYCHNNYTYGKTNDKYLAVCFYEKSTETIRLYPQNYCLVSFQHEGTKDYLQMDRATAQFLPILQKQADEYEKEKHWTCHIGKSDDFLRERFAWLIGEDMKKKNNNIKFRIVNSLIK